jgi:hypothetical protein
MRDRIAFTSKRRSPSRGEVLDLAQRLADDAELIGGVVDREAAVVAERAALAAQDVEAQGVEGAHGQLGGGRAIAEQVADALAHLLGGLVGEGQGGDGLGADAEIEEVSDAIGDDAGLARASAGQDQERATAVEDRGPLRRVELGRVDHRGRRYGSTRARSTPAIAAASVARCRYDGACASRGVDRRAGGP